jgi:hypothetical protein
LAQLIDFNYALYLSQQPLEQPKVAAGDANDCYVAWSSFFAIITFRASS